MRWHRLDTASARSQGIDQRPRYLGSPPRSRFSSEVSTTIGGMNSSLDDLTQSLRSFARERDWEQFHNPKNLAMALAGEAGELVAEFQWLTPEQADDLTPEGRTRVAAEMADVLSYLVRLADVLDIDLLKATTAKIAENARRYPVTTSRGSAEKARDRDSEESLAAFAAMMSAALKRPACSSSSVSTKKVAAAPPRGGRTAADVGQQSGASAAADATVGS